MDISPQNDGECEQIKPGVPDVENHGSEPPHETLPSHEESATSRETQPSDSSAADEGSHTETLGATDTLLPPPRKWLRRYSKLMFLLTLLLIFMGGLVTSHDAGLSVPDWPTSFGRNMFTYPPSDWLGPENRGSGGEGPFWEHSHRLVASLIGVCTVIWAFWLVFRDTRLWVGLCGFGAVILVIGQGILGGITVLLGLPLWASLLHGVLAQTFLIVVVVLTYGQSLERRARQVDTADPPHVSLWRWSHCVVALIYIQLILGALMRHSGAGLAIPDFPTTAGRVVPILNQDALEWVNTWRKTYGEEMGLVFPPVGMGQMHMHFTHRLVAVVLAAATAFLAHRTRRFARGNKRLTRTVSMLVSLVVIQFLLGAWTVLSVRDPIIASFHVVTGAALLAWATLLALRILPVRLQTPSARRATAQEGSGAP